MLTCKNCQQVLPESSFERYPTGTRRGVCRQCHYQLHVKAAKRKWLLRQRADALMRR